MIISALWWPEYTLKWFLSCFTQILVFIVRRAKKSPRSISTYVVVPPESSYKMSNHYILRQWTSCMRQSYNIISCWCFHPSVLFILWELEPAWRREGFTPLGDLWSFLNAFGLREECGVPGENPCSHCVSYALYTAHNTPGKGPRPSLTSEKHKPQRKKIVKQSHFPIHCVWESEYSPTVNDFICCVCT